MRETDELICLFNGRKGQPSCFTPIWLQPGQTEAVCPTCGTRHILEEGRWKRATDKAT